MAYSIQFKLQAVSVLLRLGLSEVKGGRGVVRGLSFQLCVSFSVQFVQHLIFLLADASYQFFFACSPQYLHPSPLILITPVQKWNLGNLEVPYHVGYGERSSKHKQTVDILDEPQFAIGQDHKVDKQVSQTGF